MPTRSARWERRRNGGGLYRASFIDRANLLGNAAFTATPAITRSATQSLSPSQGELSGSGKNLRPKTEALGACPCVFEVPLTESGNADVCTRTGQPVPAAGHPWIVRILFHTCWPHGRQNWLVLQHKCGLWAGPLFVHSIESGHSDGAPTRRPADYHLGEPKGSACLTAPNHSGLD